jgi:hypothetical protein
LVKQSIAVATTAAIELDAQGVGVTTNTYSALSEARLKHKTNAEASSSMIAS